MSTSTDEPNAYDILGVTIDVSDADLRKAYRSQALKVHPDHRPDDPVAGQKFHELTEAYELLKDQTKRQALDVSIRAKLARKERYAAHDSKRKAMIDELEDNERNFKKRKAEKAKQESEESRELERIKEQSRKLREGKGKASRTEPVVPAPPAPPEIGPLDTTVRLKFQTNRFPNLLTKPAIVEFLQSNGFDAFDTEAVVLSLKPSKSHPDKPPKFCTILIPFTTVGDAFAAVSTSERKRLDGITATWASGTEPRILSYLDRVTGEMNTEPSPSEKSNASQPPDSPLDLEAITLMRLRRAEREKLEQEIRDRDE